MGGGCHNERGRISLRSKERAGKGNHEQQGRQEEIQNSSGQQMQYAR